MSQFRLIPVIDLKDNKVVHGKKGQRDQYQPIKSIIAPTSDPLDIAEAFWNLGLQELYIADIDSLQGQKDNFSSIKKLQERKKNQILLDFGLRSSSQIFSLINLGIPKIILALETLSSETFVQEAIEIAADRIIMSLDTRNGQIMTQCENFKGMNLLNIAMIFYEMGISEMIVLDLESVGSNQGVPYESALELKKELDIAVVTGGGIRNLKDLKLLEEIGLDGCLVATALHNGAISKNDVKTFLKT